MQFDLGNVLPPTLLALPLEAIVRIDAALEGDWSGTVVPVWSRADGFLGFERVVRAHATHRPALELYFPGWWIGVHCHRAEAGSFVFDEPRARAVIAYVEATLAASA